MLTHLLGQSVDELRDKIAVYRQAWREAGHDGSGKVTLMLHTFVAENDEYAREQVREPMTEYLRSSTNLLKDYAQSFPAVRGSRDGLDDAFRQLSDQDLDALLEHAFNRYYETSGLFGSQKRCLEMVQRVQDVGVDEIACLIDFGIDSQTVLDHLQSLNELQQVATGSGEHDSVGALLPLPSKSPCLVPSRRLASIRCPAIKTMWRTRLDVLVGSAIVPKI